MEFEDSGIPWRKPYFPELGNNLIFPKKWLMTCHRISFSMENYGELFSLVKRKSSRLLGLGGTTFKNQWRLHTGWIMIKLTGIHSDSWCLIFPHPKEIIKKDITNYVCALPPPSSSPSPSRNLLSLPFLSKMLHSMGRIIDSFKLHHLHYVKEQIILRRYFRISWIKEEKESSWEILPLLMKQADLKDSSNTR